MKEQVQVALVASLIAGVLVLAGIAIASVMKGGFFLLLMLLIIFACGVGAGWTFRR